MHCIRRLTVQTLVFSRSYLHRQVSPPETLVVKGGTTWARIGRWIWPENARLPHNIQGSFTCRKSTTWDKRIYFPSEGRRAEDFFSPWKNPTASAGFEPANLGTKGQHATTRPPKPLTSPDTTKWKITVFARTHKTQLQFSPIHIFNWATSVTMISPARATVKVQFFLVFCCQVPYIKNICLYRTKHKTTGVTFCSLTASGTRYPR